MNALVPEGHGQGGSLTADLHMAHSLFLLQESLGLQFWATSFDSQLVEEMKIVGHDIISLVSICHNFSDPFHAPVVLRIHITGQIKNE